ncbi:MAG: hypothetical protein AAGJ35_04485, partial [Myxococcota bacterium]
HQPQLLSQPEVLIIEQARISLKNKNDSNPYWIPQIQIPLPPVNKIEKRIWNVGTLPYLIIQTPKTIQGKVFGRKNQEDLISPCASCTLRLHTQKTISTSQSAPVILTFFTRQTSSAQGMYSIPSLFEHFRLEVQPPIKSKWAKATLSSQEVPNGPLNLQLAPKVTYQGQIQSKSCQAQNSCTQSLQNIQVVAFWKQELVGQSQQPIQYQPQFTNNNGSFTLQLDSGIYDLLLIPPVGSPWARTILPNVLVEKNDFQTQVSNIAQAKYFIATVKVPNKDNDRFGFPIEGVKVELFQIHDPKQTQDLPNTYLLGQHTTDEVGKFSIPYHPPSQ